MLDPVQPWEFESGLLKGDAACSPNTEKLLISVGSVHMDEATCTIEFKNTY